MHGTCIRMRHGTSHTGLYLVNVSRTQHQFFFILFYRRLASVLVSSHRHALSKRIQKSLKPAIFDVDLVIWFIKGDISYTDYFTYIFLPFEHTTPKSQEAACSVGWGVNVDSHSCFKAGYLINSVGLLVWPSKSDVWIVNANTRNMQCMPTHSTHVPQYIYISSTLLKEDTWQPPCMWVYVMTMNCHKLT